MSSIYLRTNSRNEQKKTRQTKTWKTTIELAENGPSQSMEELSLLFILRDAIVQHFPINDLKKILSCQPIDINRAVRRGLRLLHYAVFENDYDSSRLLVEDFSADVNVLDDAGYSPLHLASKYGHIDLIHLLIENGSLINFRTLMSNTSQRSSNISYQDIVSEPLSLCLEHNHIDCARLLIYSGADVNQKYFLGFEINVLPYENLAALELILKNGANPNALSRSGLTPLIKACREANIHAVILLCRYGADVNYVTRKFRQRNAILTSIEMKRPDIVEQLLAYGGFVNRNPDLPNSPIEFAIRKDQFQIVQLLIAFGADTNESIQSITPLTLACQCSYLKSQYEIIKSLLENKADPNPSGNFSFHQDHIYFANRTPLVTYIRHVQDQQIDLRIVRILIGFGARVSFSRGRDSVLRSLRRFQSNHRLIELLCQASYNFHLDYLEESNDFDEKTKLEIIRYARTARSLKNTVRHQIRKILFQKSGACRIDKMLDSLPVDKFLKNYLLFHDV